MTLIERSRAGRALKLVTRLRNEDPLERQAAGYVVLDHVRRRFLPDYLLTDYRKNWYKDKEYLAKYRRFKPDADTDADRKFFKEETRSSPLASPVSCFIAPYTSPSSILLRV